MIQPLRDIYDELPPERARQLRRHNIERLAALEASSRARQVRLRALAAPGKPLRFGQNKTL